MKSTSKALIGTFVISLLVIVPLVFILGLAFGAQFGSNGALTQDSISSWVSAAATVSIAVLTIVLARETWILREIQMEQVNRIRIEAIRPEVQVELVPSDHGMNLMLIRISNRGKGVAKGVSFSLTNRDGSPATAETNPIFEDIAKLGVIRRGITSIGVGQTIESFVLNFFDLRGKLGAENVLTPYLSVTVSYADAEGNVYSNQYVMDFSEYEGITQVGGGNPLHKLASELEKVRKKIESAVKGSGRVQVDSFSTRDRNAEAEERRQWLESVRKKE